MTLTKIKREFVRLMEEGRVGEPYAKNFMGCLMSIIIEHEPISQERMMELTGYSQATVSLVLQKLQILMPIRTTRKIGDRKHYYSYDGPPERFVLDLWQKRLDAQAIDIRQIESSIEGMSRKTDRDAASERFYDYLKNLQLYLKLVYDLRNTGIAKFERVLGTDSYESQSMKSLEKGVLAKFLKRLRQTSAESDSNRKLKGKALKNYLHSKNEYYSGLKTNLNPLYSQTVANQMIVVHDVFVEGCTSQEELEKSTLLPRSTISDVLAVSVKIGIIRVTKKQGSRIKLYQPVISFTDLMLGNYDLVARHISEVMPRLSKYTMMVKRTRTKSKEAKKFLEILKNLERAYAFTRDYSNAMKVEMVKRLKEEYDRGFVFI
ncbi:MAG: hypothetical protein KGD60_10120 [Candidatus Thorarchaeota archaeon]|nr:hypothetical protein [Candidatus Thorarchaeota archaeon]